MPHGETYKRRLPLYGPLNIKSLEEFLEEANKSFPENYKGQFPYRISLDKFELLYLIGKGAYGHIILSKSTIFTGSYYALKAIRKKLLVKQEQIEHALNEKRILQSVNSPFLVRLEYFAQDNSHLYLFLPFICGGDLFTHLKQQKHFDEDVSTFLAAQVVLGIEYLHHVSLVYRDLKPENLLIDHLGYLKITDLGFAKIVSSRTYTFCGTPDYIAPEMVLGQGYGKAVDWWAFGVLLYELNSGHPPFTAKNHMQLFDQIVQNDYKMPDDFSEDLQDLISNLMHVEVSRRLGSFRGGAQDIKDHPWFRHVDWLLLLNRRVPSPYIPPEAETISTKYFPKLKRITELRISQHDKYKQYFDEF